MIVVAQEGHIPDDLRGGVDSNKPSVSSGSCQLGNTNVMTERLGDIITLRAAFSASESVSAWVTPVGSAES